MCGWARRGLGPPIGALSLMPRRMARRILVSFCAVVTLFVLRNTYSIRTIAEHLPPAPAKSVAPAIAQVDEGATLPCAADGFLNRGSSSTGERYLVYAPQFGLSNQLVALRNAVAWAQLLDRTLVLPHLLAHGSVHPRAPFGLAFDATSARPALAPLRIIEIDPFLRLGLAPAGVIALATTNRFRSADGGEYFDSLGVTWHRAADGSANMLSVSMSANSSAGTAFSPAAIRNAFGGCARGHAVLAFQSLFAAFDPKPLSMSPPGWSVCANGIDCMAGLPWLDKHALPALLTPSLALDGLSASIASQLTRADGDAPAGRELLCAHIRRGDFKEECAKYEVERTRKDARSWVRWHHQNGYGCWQSQNELALNLRVAATSQARAGRRPLAVYVSMEDAAALQSMPALRPFNVTTLATFEPLLRQALLPLPPALSAILVDQLTCARSKRLLLNAFSTFSQLVIGRMGLTHRDTLGWVRDLSRQQQQALGVSVAFWRREDTARAGQLVAKL